MSKDCTTVLFCTNADGSARLPPLVVGSRQQPRAFGEATGAALGFDYHASSKAWVNFAIFIECLWRFNTFIGETAGRRALLLLDNASVHGREEDLPDFPNVQVKFLPKRTTSILQPLDLSIIACFQRRFQKKQAQREVDLIEKGIS